MFSKFYRVRFILFLMLLISCNSTTNINSQDKNTDTTTGESEETIRNVPLDAFDSIYVGTWQSDYSIKMQYENNDTESLKDTYLRITKPDDYYRIEMKSSLPDKYNMLETRFWRYLGSAEYLKQLDGTDDFFINYEKDKQQLLFQNNYFINGAPTGAFAIYFHRIN